MRKFYVAASFISTLILSTTIEAQDFTVTNPSLRLNGPNVNLNFNLAEIPPAQRDVRIFFCGECRAGQFTEDTEIQRGTDWYLSTGLNKSTVRQMVRDGWFIQSIFNLNATQMYVVFIK